MKMNIQEPSRLNQHLSGLIKSGAYQSNSGLHPYINFSKLIIQIATGKTYKQLIEERNILKGEKITDYLYKKERERIPAIEDRIISLLDESLKYPEIKNLLTK